MTENPDTQGNKQGGNQHSASAKLIPFPSPQSRQGPGSPTIGNQGVFTSSSIGSGSQNHTPVSFERRELDQLLNVYGFKVGSGEWRDYAIDMLKDRAIFSVFQRQGDVPLYQIEKNPRLARRQGAFSITNAAGQILKRGHELPIVLRYFEKKVKLKPV